ncbi:hypothetical protein BGM25_09115 [Bacillus sp. FJAT-29953]|nr:hypothetical protein [Bacillus sp. FJAT-29953]
MILVVSVEAAFFMSIEKVVKDAASWDPIKYEELVSWPIELSSELLESSVDPEMKREKLISLPEGDEAEHRSEELRLHEGTLRPIWVKLFFKILSQC